jgi:kynureninase
VLTWYQARAGQILTQAIGAARLRAYSLDLQRRLVGLLAERGVNASGGTEDRGAFVVVRFAAARAARACADALAARGVATDARGAWLRLCPDLLTTAEELERASSVLGEIAGPAKS